MMMKRLAFVLLALAPWTLGCGAQPKQVAPPVFEDTGGQDIAPEEDKELIPAAKMPDEMSAKEKRGTCCKQCAKGLAEDRTGEAPDKIPCADFTVALEEWCLDYFRSTPTMASECQGDAAAAPGGGEPDKPPSDAPAGDG